MLQVFTPHLFTTASDGLVSVDKDGVNHPIAIIDGTLLNAGMSGNFVWLLAEYQSKRSVYLAKDYLDPKALRMATRVDAAISVCPDASDCIGVVVFTRGIIRMINGSLHALTGEKVSPDNDLGIRSALINVLVRLGAQNPDVWIPVWKRFNQMDLETSSRLSVTARPDEKPSHRYSRAMIVRAIDMYKEIESIREMIRTGNATDAILASMYLHKYNDMPEELSVEVALRSDSLKTIQLLLTKTD